MFSGALDLYYRQAAVALSQRVSPTTMPRVFPAGIPVLTGAPNNLHTNLTAATLQAAAAAASSIYNNPPLNANAAADHSRPSSAEKT